MLVLIWVEWIGSIGKAWRVEILINRNGNRGLVVACWDLGSPDSSSCLASVKSFYHRFSCRWQRATVWPLVSHGPGQDFSTHANLQNLSSISTGQNLALRTSNAFLWAKYVLCMISNNYLLPQDVWLDRNVDGSFDLGFCENHKPRSLKAEK